MRVSVFCLNRMGICKFWINLSFMNIGHAGLSVYMVAFHTIVMNICRSICPRPKRQSTHCVEVRKVNSFGCICHERPEYPVFWRYHADATSPSYLVGLRRHWLIWPTEHGCSTPVSTILALCLRGAHPRWSIMPL